MTTKLRKNYVPNSREKYMSPKQRDFFKIPRRFGAIPIDKAPLGCDPKLQYQKIYPRIPLPFQHADTVSFGHPKLEPNRLLWGDNLHVMRMLDSNSIDLIYIDPPFFSNKQYNLVFGDQNEVRSFNDVWEGGMPGNSKREETKVDKYKLQEKQKEATGKLIKMLDFIRLISKTVSSGINKRS